MKSSVICDSIISIITKISKSIKSTAKALSFRVSKSRWPRILLALLIIGLLLFLAKSLFLAALVNGRPISRISLVKELEKQGGQKVLDSLIEKSLIFQEGARAGVKIDKEVVDQEISRIETLLKEQKLTLDEALSMRGETRTSLSEQVRLQKTVEALLAQKINISEEETKAYFDNNKEIFGTNAKFEDVKSNVKDQLYQQKLNGEYSKWIEGLKTKARIIYLLKF